MPNGYERSNQQITGMTVSVELAPGGYYQGYNVFLNGQPLWFRPYDGSDTEEVVAEVTEALCEVLRAHTGRGLPKDDDDDA